MENSGIYGLSEYLKKLKELEEKELDKQKIIFCTECNEDLKNFCFTDGKDIDSIKKNFSRCKEIGKFKGEFCSKLFIADNNNMENLLDEE